jgi:hypothetical protein
MPERMKVMENKAAAVKTPWAGFLIAVGPEDLYTAIAWLNARKEVSLEEAAWGLRVLVDRPLDTLELAERLGLAVVQGLRVLLTPAGQAWAMKPEHLPQRLGMLVSELPLGPVQGWLEEGPVPQVRLVELFRGPLAEQAALALADWGELFGRWRQEAGWLYQRKREAL